MLSYLTAGESHGSSLITIITGLPLGLPIDVRLIQEALRRRRVCAGRGPRMHHEKDTVRIESGIRKGKTIGSPVTVLVPNAVADIDRRSPLTNARPGQIDLAAARKFNLTDVRDITERSSARETAARLVAGTLAQLLLNHFNIKVIGYVTGIGGLSSPASEIPSDYNNLFRTRKHSPFYCPVARFNSPFKELLARVARNGDTVGGVFEVRAFNVPVGLGDHTQWDLRLDGRLAQMLISIPAVKGVEIGAGFGYAGLRGSEAHDGIIFQRGRAVINQGGGFRRSSNNAGGIEGGLTNGEDILLRAVVKAVPTLKRPSLGVDLRSGRPCRAVVESADTCAVPAAAIIGEGVVAFEIARAFLERFGGITLAELKQHFLLYQKKGAPPTSIRNLS